MLNSDAGVCSIADTGKDVAMPQRNAPLNPLALVQSSEADDTAGADCGCWPGENSRWNTWRGLAAATALGFGVIGWPAIFSIGVPLLIAAHVLLAAALLFNSAPRGDRARAAAVFLPLIWWPATLMAAPGAVAVLLAWAAYRGLRGPARDGSAWPRPVIAAAAAAGAGSFTVLFLLLFN